MTTTSAPPTPSVVLVHSLRDDIAAALGAAQKPIAASCFDSATTTAGWHGVPSYALVTTVVEIIRATIAGIAAVGAAAEHAPVTP